MSPFRVEALSDAHDRSMFQCGEEALDRYFKSQVTQDVRRRVATCFVAIERSSGAIAGYYTLSASSIPLVDLPAEHIKRLPRYPAVPAVCIGRLAVDQRFQKRGLGEGLLIDITLRIIGTEIGVALLVVDAKDARAADFYARYQFRAVKSSGRTMFLPMATAVNLFASHDLH